MPIVKNRIIFNFQSYDLFIRIENACVFILFSKLMFTPHTIINYKLHSKKFSYIGTYTISSPNFGNSLNNI
jgi:hypothetical protein